jgi:hypothetical protein
MTQQEGAFSNGRFEELWGKAMDLWWNRGSGLPLNIALVLFFGSGLLYWLYKVIAG